MEGFVRRIWTGLVIDKVVQIRKGLFLMRFVNKEDAVKVAQKGIFHFDHKPFIVKTWSP